MCGIAGLLRQDGRPIDVDLLHRMTGILAHRGPDGDGFYVDGSVGFGHRRLAIIDLSGGAQPMASVDGSVWITFNGEIYNYRLLREELEARGVRFRTRSDTEVIVAAYQAWGLECLGRLRGMFAFAIWDNTRRRLFAARDRVGIKPLVYAWEGGCLRFASEIKALLEDPTLPRDIDWPALGGYFTEHYVAAPGSMFRAVRKLPPGSYLTCSMDGGDPVVRRYWDVRMVADPDLREDVCVEELAHVLEEAVRLHMVSDVPVGAFLSGGVDSSSVVACMARSSTRPIKTFSIGFDETNFDEIRYARLVAKRYRTEHVEMVVKPDAIALLPRLAWQFDEPFADVSAVPSYCVAKVTREHVTVALSGDGGDENFAGYRRYAEAQRLHERIDKTPAVMLKPLLRRLAARRAPGARGREYMGLLSMSPVDRYVRMMTYQTEETLGSLLTAETGNRIGTAGGPRTYARLAAEAASEDYLSALQYIDIHRYLPEDILTKVDRTSMLTSLETRVPLLDHVVIEYAARMPSSLKLRGGRGKHVLKAAMRPHLPAEVLGRRKMGFGVPLESWFRRELKEFSRDLLGDRRTRQRGIFRPETLEALLDSHQGGRHDHSAVLWSCICFELWCRTWWDR